MYMQGFSQLQDWNWAQSGGGNSAEYTASIVSDEAGNTFVAGYFSSDTVFFGDSTLVLNVNDDIFLLRYDVSGNLIWAKRFGGSGYDYPGALATDIYGNVYMTGYFGSDTIDFDNYMLVSEGYDDLFIVKILPDGMVSWAKSYGGDDFEWGMGIACDNNGNLYITGLFDSDTLIFGGYTFYNKGSDDILLAKFDNSGNLQWAMASGNAQADAGTAVSTTSDGSVFLTGNYFGGNYLIFGSDTLFGSGGYDAFITKFDASGSVLWSNSLQGNNNDFIRACIPLDNGEVYIAGSFFSDTLALGSLELVTQGGEDAFFAKLDNTGEPIWAGRYGGTDWDRCTGLTIDPSDNLYLCGNFRSPSISFGSTTLTNSGSSNIFLVKFNLNGNVQWAKKAGGTYSDIASGVSVDQTGNVYMAGDFSSGSISFGTHQLYNAGFSDMYLAKLSVETSGTYEFENKLFSFAVYPNPSTEFVNIAFLLHKKHNVDIDIYNILGEKYAELIKDINLNEGTYSFPAELPEGIYVITICVDGTRSSKLVVIQQ